MKKGDYMVHIFVEKAKEMKVEAGNTIDPMFVIECFGKKIYSSAKDDISGLGETAWNEHLFIEGKEIDKK
jgi:hypothetical protein